MKYFNNNTYIDSYNVENIVDELLDIAHNNPNEFLDIMNTHEFFNTKYSITNDNSINLLNNKSLVINPNVHFTNDILYSVISELKKIKYDCQQIDSEYNGTIFQYLDNLLKPKDYIISFRSGERYNIIQYDSSMYNDAFINDNDFTEGFDYLTKWDLFHRKDIKVLVDSSKFTFKQNITFNDCLLYIDEIKANNCKIVPINKSCYKLFVRK